MLIRELRASDSIDELTALLHRAYARLGAMGLNYTAVDQTAEVTRKRIQGGHCLVAVDGHGRLVGTIVGQPTYASHVCEYFTRPGVAAVHQYAVDPDLQGRGIGRALLAEAEAWAAAQGHRELAMDTAEQAGHLLALYQGLGYEPVGWVQWPGKVYRSRVLSKPLIGSAAPASTTPVRLTPAHAPAYRALMLDAYDRHPDAFTSSAAERAGLPLSWWEARLAPGDRPGELVFGAFAGGGTLAGVAGLSFDGREKARHKALLFGMYVPVAHRQAGLGGALVRAVLAAAQARPGVRLAQLTVTDGNEAARALYARHGFVPFGLEPLAVAVEDGFVSKVHMWRDLSKNEHDQV